MTTPEDLLLKTVRARLTEAGWDRVEPAIAVLGAIQRLYCLEGEGAASYVISTGAAGFGNEEGSGKTATGLLAIDEKIGDGEPLGMVFKGRQPTGEVILETDDPAADLITSRILRLEGREAGINRGGDVDARARYIYIHGTPHEKDLGRPASHGCIRMAGRDIVELFQRVKPGTLVYVAPDADSPPGPT